MRHKQTRRHGRFLLASTFHLDLVARVERGKVKGEVEEQVAASLVLALRLAGSHPFILWNPNNLEALP